LFVLWSLVFLLAAIQANFDPRLVWEKIEWAESDADRKSTGGAMVEPTS
jgi:hypothetical protein